MAICPVNPSHGHMLGWKNRGGYDYYCPNKHQINGEPTEGIFANDIWDGQAYITTAIKAVGYDKPPQPTPQQAHTGPRMIEERHDRRQKRRRNR